MSRTIARVDSVALWLIVGLLALNLLLTLGLGVILVRSSKEVREVYRVIVGAEVTAEFNQS